MEANRAAIADLPRRIGLKRNSDFWELLSRGLKRLCQAATI
jgi:hypothetical protein